MSDGGTVIKSGAENEKIEKKKEKARTELINFLFSLFSSSLMVLLFLLAVHHYNPNELGAFNSITSSVTLFLSIIALGCMLGLTVAKPINQLIDRYVRRLYEGWQKKFSDESEKKDKQAVNWVDITRFLESSQLNNLLSRISRMKIREEFELPAFVNKNSATQKLSAITMLIFRIQEAIRETGEEYDKDSGDYDITDEPPKLRILRNKLLSLKFSITFWIWIEACITVLLPLFFSLCIAYIAFHLTPSSSLSLPVLLGEKMSCGGDSFCLTVYLFANLGLIIVAALLGMGVIWFRYAARNEESEQKKDKTPLLDWLRESLSLTILCMIITFLVVLWVRFIGYLPFEFSQTLIPWDISQAATSNTAGAQATDNNGFKSIFNFIAAMSFLCFSLPLASLFHSMILWSLNKWIIGSPGRLGALVLRLSLSALFIGSGVLLIYIAISLISMEKTIIAYLDAYRELLFPFTKVESTIINDWFKDSPGQLLIARLITISLTTYVVYHLVQFLVDQYETMYDRRRDTLAAPPELIKIGAMFMLFVFITGFAYASGLTYFAQVDNLRAENIRNNPKDGTQPPGNPGSSASGNVSGGIVVQPRSNSFSDFIPYSVFLAIIGAAITVASRDLLENYFAGLALRVNAPFEEGDRVIVADSGMCEVREIGLRSTEFYGIQQNSHINIPHKELSSQIVHNYTQPTLDYRRAVNINVPDMRFPLRSEISNRLGETTLKNFPGEVPDRAEALLLLVAYLATGVKRPQPFNLKSRERLREILKFKAKKGAEALDTIQWIEPPEDKGVQSWKTEQGFKADLREFWELIKTDKKYDLEPMFLQGVIRQLTTIQDEDKAAAGKAEKERSKKRPIEIFKIPKPQEERDDSVELIDRRKQLEWRIVWRIASVISTMLTLNDQMPKLLKVTGYEHGLQRQGMLIVEEHFIEEIDPEVIHKISHLSKQVSNHYFALSKLLWSLKETYKSYSRKRHIDTIALKLLDVPRIHSSHQITADGIKYWKCELAINVELSEQSEEIMHHINLLIDKYREYFAFPREVLKPEVDSSPQKT